MKKIFLFWALFAVLFFGIVLFAQKFNINTDIVIIVLLSVYAIFQFISLRNAYKSGANWLIGSIIVQAIFAVASPLYYSNFGDPVYELISGQWFDTVDALDPCHLCWWARIMMFPLLPLSIIYAITKNKGILWYAYIITIPGICLEIFHYILQKPYLIGKTTIINPFGCTAANPCAALHVDYMGFITIPLLCLVAFLIIHIFAAFLLFSKKIEKATKRI